MSEKKNLRHFRNFIRKIQIYEKQIVFLVKATKFDNYNNRCKNQIMIGFAKELVPLIRKGEKTLTYRIGDKYKYLEAGDIILTNNSSTNEVFAELEIVSKKNVIFGELPISKKGHETYSSRSEMKHTFEKYYQMEIEDSAPVIVLEFKVKKLL